MLPWKSSFIEETHLHPVESPHGKYFDRNALALSNALLKEPDLNGSQWG